MQLDVELVADETVLVPVLVDSELSLVGIVPILRYLGGKAGNGWLGIGSVQSALTTDAIMSLDSATVLDL
jgi:hypothetical protein